MKKLSWLVMPVAVLLAVGCGQGEGHDATEVNQGKEQINVDQTKKSTTANIIKLPMGYSRRPGESACVDAHSVTGQSSSDITITVRCIGVGDGGRVNFVIRDDRIENGPKKRIENFDRIPVISQNGKTRRFGFCEKNGSVLTCGARVHGAVKIHENLMISGFTSCSFKLAVVVATASPCTHNVCGGTVNLSELFDGKPKDC